MHLHAAAILSATLSLASAATWNSTNSTQCRNLPGDASWPSPQDWAQLNSSVNGQLIATVPLAARCHGSLYSADECYSVQSGWNEAWIHIEDPASVQNPYFLNNSCSPFTPNGGCVNGNLAEYSINVTGAADVVAGLKFAEEKNIRLTIKNTGHDFLGRSSGKGSLSLWTHNLKDIEFLNYTSPSYSGAAIKMGAGVQAYEAYDAAYAHGLRIVGGFCPTVGLAGGYSQGGGHGPLNGEYGLGADNTLEWEVVTAEGEYLIANKEQNSDLYWALSGGGGGTYGVVLSLTARAHAEGPVAGGTLEIQSAGISADAYWDAVSKFNEQLPAIIAETGIELIYTLQNTSFSLNFLTWPGHTAADVTEVLAPFTSYLNASGIPYTPKVSGDKTYHDHFARYTPNLPFGNYQINELLGGRNVPTSVFENNNAGLTAALRNITLDTEWSLNAVCANTSHARVGNAPGDNAVMPAWRDTLAFINFVVLWDPAAPLEELQRKEDMMTYEKVPQLERLTPGGGTYINEGDFNNPNWKVDYFGANYERLVAVKKKYDPNDLFYALPNVGNDVWKVEADGRLCRA